MADNKDTLFPRRPEALLVSDQAALRKEVVAKAAGNVAAAGETGPTAAAAAVLGLED